MPTKAKGPNTGPRPPDSNPRVTWSQSRMSQPATSPASIQKEAVSPKQQKAAGIAKKGSITHPKESTPEAPSQPPSLLSLIADGIRQIINNYEPSDKVKLALSEVLRYTRKAIEDEVRRKEVQAKEESAEDKLGKSSKQLNKAVERLESVAVEIHAKLSVVSNTTS